MMRGSLSRPKKMPNWSTSVGLRSKRRRQGQRAQAARIADVWDVREHRNPRALTQSDRADWNRKQLSEGHRLWRRRCDGRGARCGRGAGRVRAVAGVPEALALATGAALARAGACSMAGAWCAAAQPTTHRQQVVRARFIGTAELSSDWTRFGAGCASDLGLFAASAQPIQAGNVVGCEYSDITCPKQLG